MIMSMKLRSIVLGLLLTLATPLAAFAQCSGQAPATTYCGNPTGVLGLPGWKPISAIPLTLPTGDIFYGIGGIATAQTPAQSGLVQTVTPEQFAGGGTASSDNGPAINAAVAAATGPTLLKFGCGTYQIITPAVISKQGFVIEGQGSCTVLQFAPTADGTMIKFSRGASNTAENAIRHLQFYSTDTTHTKVALNLSDVSSFEAGDLACSGAGANGTWSGGTGSTCLQTNGRDTSSFHDFRFGADQPIVIGVNPNASNIGEDSDHFHFWNMVLFANSTFNVVTFLTGVVPTETTFDGYEALIGGTDCVHAVDATSSGNWHNVTFANVRCEQGAVGTGWSFNIQVNAGNRLTNLNIINPNLDSGRNGIKLRRVIGSYWLNGSYFPTGAGGTTSFDIDSTDDDVKITNMLWGTSATVSNSGLTQNDALYPNTAGFASGIPVSAFYSGISSPRLFSAIQPTLLLAPGSSSGTATIQAQAAAGTPTINWPTVSGTLANGASSPLVLNATTGNLTCPTCVTSSGGGAISGTAPISVSAAGVISINAPYASLTASTGGIVYSGAANLAILAGTATASLPLLSGSTAAPTWSTIGYPTSATSGGIPYFSSTATMATSALLAANQIVIGGGAGTAPSTLGSLGTTSTVLHGNAAGPPSFGSVANADLATMATNTIKGNATSGSAAPTDLSIGGCSSASSALIWTTNTGFGCNTSITANSVPAANLTGSTLAAGITASSLTSLGTITILTATTINAFTLGGTIAGGGNQINNVIIGASTPLAGSFTTASASTSVTSPIIYGGSAAGSTLTLQSTSSGSPSGDSISLKVGGSTVATFLAGSTPIIFQGTAGTSLPEILSSATTNNAAWQYSDGTNNAYAGFMGGSGCGAGIWAIYTSACMFTVTQAGVVAAKSNTASTSKTTGSLVVTGGLGVSGATFTDTLSVITMANTATTSAVCYDTSTGLLTYNGTVGTCTVSDERLKNMGPRIDHALDKLLSINGVYYTWKDPKRMGKGRQIGVGAQTVEKVFPELVQDDSSGYKSADYQRLTAPIIEALRELKAANDNLKSEIAALKAARK